MKTIIPNFQENIVAFFRSCGYAFQKSEGEEFAFMSRLTGEDYPRFHIYAHLEDKNLIINLHLDQKKPSYEGTSVHGGEYSGELVENEIRRVESFAKQNKIKPPVKLKPW